MGTSCRKSSARAEEGLLPVLLTATSKSLWCLQVTTVTTATPNNPKVTRQRKYIVSTKGVYRRCFSWFIFPASVILSCKLVHPPSVACLLLTEDPGCMTPELLATYLTCEASHVCLPPW